MKAAVSHFEIQKVRAEESISEADLVVTEEPLEIRLKYFNGIDFTEKRLAVTMRTPGNDFELAMGFLLTEGIIQSKKDVEKIFYCTELKDEREKDNVVIVVMNRDLQVDEQIFNRNFYVNSSCGVCGKSSIESVEVLCEIDLSLNDLNIPATLVQQIPDLALQAQDVFRHTGGLHASVLFSQSGNIEISREDVGRHNALDKLIGAGLQSDMAFSDKVLFVSGRAGFELVQKCLVTGIPIMIAVGAPSSLAVELARDNDLTLVGFARGHQYNVYSGGQRIS